MSEFQCIPNPQPSNWIVFEQALSICADIIRSSKYRPSIKNQGAIIGLLLDQVEACYGTEFTGRDIQDTGRNEKHTSRRGKDDLSA